MNAFAVVHEIRCLTAIVCTIAAAAGCSAPRRTFQPEHDPVTLDDVSFLHYLATVPVVTVDEGLRAVLLLTDEKTSPTTFEQRYDLLLRRGAVKPAWRLRPDQVLDKGSLAYMLRIICELPRGLNEFFASVTGLGDRRYALNTCIREELMPYAVPHEAVTGGELLSALTAVERYLASRRTGFP